MKKKMIVLLVIIAIVIIGIIVLNINANNKEVELDKTFKLSVGESVTVKDSNMVIRLVSVDDSRCKDGTQCIWSGEIEYKIKVNKKRIVLGTVRHKTINHKGYKYVLDENNNSTKYVRMKVIKK